MLIGTPWKFFKMFLLQLGFLDGKAGFVVAALGSYYVFLKYAKLWEMVAVEGQEAGAGQRVEYGRKGES